MKSPGNISDYVISRPVTGVVGSVLLTGADNGAMYTALRTRTKCTQQLLETRSD